MTTTLLLGIIAFFTSTLTGIFGLGGGLLLLGFMPIFLPASVVIPVHGVIQLCSNISRAYFSWRDIQWPIFRPYLIGGLIGVVCCSVVLQSISLAYMPLFIGLYILLSQWSNGLNQMLKRIENYQLLGFLQVGLSLFSGTIGPVHMVLLNKHYQDKNAIIATGAGLMSVKHGLKAVTFILLGVPLWQYWDMLLIVSIAAIAGSYLGTQLRGKINRQHFKLILKMLLTLLAIRMIINVF